VPLRKKMIRRFPLRIIIALMKALILPEWYVRNKRTKETNKGNMLIKPSYVITH
jgi:hypothetical protein